MNTEALQPQLLLQSLASSHSTGGCCQFPHLLCASEPIHHHSLERKSLRWPQARAMKHSASQREAYLHKLFHFSLPSSCIYLSIPLFISVWILGILILYFGLESTISMLSCLDYSSFCHWEPSLWPLRPFF